MSTKRCSYRNCNSITNAKSHPSSVTFFAFPKHPARYKLWLKLGGCQEENISPVSRYFCSKHFDESKYIAHNQRRKQLLSTAVPWPYDQSPQREIVDEEVDYQCVVSTIEDNDVDDQDHDHDSIDRFQEDTVSIDVTNANITDSIDEALQSYEYNVDENNDFTIALSSAKKSLKRKLDSSSKDLEEDVDDNYAGPSNKIIVSNRATSSTINLSKEDSPKAPKEDEFDESKMTESSNMTTFIYRGQEYIQMPKEEYVNEKLALIQKLKIYEDILRNVKHLIDDVKF